MLFRSGTRSGVYAVRISGSDKETTGEDNIPFFVLPPKNERTADICVLMSTYTYTVYHNHARPEARTGWWRDQWNKQSKEWGAYPANAFDHPEYGFSTYNFHTDGSGICQDCDDDDPNTPQFDRKEVFQFTFPSSLAVVHLAHQRDSEGVKFVGVDVADGGPVWITTAPLVELSEEYRAAAASPRVQNKLSAGATPCRPLTRVAPLAVRLVGSSPMHG